MSSASRGLPTRLVAPLLCAALAGPQPAGAARALDSCLRSRGLPRVARVVGPGGEIAWARVVDDEDGVPTAVVPVAGGGDDLAAALERAAADSGHAPRWPIAASERATRLCAPVHLPQEAIDAETHVVVAAGLNYAAHAEEAGGGEAFLFPKPVEPSAPYGTVAAPAGVTLLDYEVELGFVLLADVDLDAPPSREALFAQTAFFVANDVTDREPIIRHATIRGPGTGFVEAKGKPGFLPVGPWLVRGRELFRALAACDADGLGLRLAVDEGDGFLPRQDATTAAMILEPRALLDRIADEVKRHGARTSMSVRRADRVHRYPLAVSGADGRPRLPAGSVVLTGTPEGVAFRAPAPLAVLARGLLRLRSPFEQFRREELTRAGSDARGGYLAPGDRVRASIDGLGAQIVEITSPGTAPPRGPCNDATEGSGP